ncbi:MAG TPA: tRNA glutamyl-Q(34) synthetase GluQRS [Candidatus Acidoferrales bacterium]|nr:tRNA glutamyl-Q(34) synthetase GluQRS [Candidatus Acidoferrales bacterium]
MQRRRGNLAWISENCTVLGAGACPQPFLLSVGQAKRSHVTYRGRFAPSPTGDLHMGSAATALLAWLRARSNNGEFVLRVEDIDAPRTVAGCEAGQLADLHWLGIDWDEGPDCGGPYAPYRQSERSALYDSAIARLAAQGLVYLCDCSRKEIASVSSAPHIGEEGPRYPGTCRRHGMQPRAWRRPPAVRVAVPDREVVVVDALQGELRQNVNAVVGDFVLKRGDGAYSYQLAVVVDDLAMNITEVVRGFDLLASSPRQKLLAEMLGGCAPAFAHVPMVVGSNGERLQKRDAAQRFHGRRETAKNSAPVLATIAQMLQPGASIRGTLAQILQRFDFDALRHCREVRLPLDD